jgi:hypothetical protein
MSKAIYCDGPTCTAWAKLDSEKEVERFIELYHDCEEYTFCSWKCIIKFSAVQEQLTEMPLEW